MAAPAGSPLATPGSVREPRIGYDARMSLGEYRGMGRYLRTLIAGRERKLLGFCASGETDPRLRLIARGMHAYPLWEQLSLPRLVRDNAVDVFIAPYNTAPLHLPPGTRLILIIHDLIYMEPLPRSRSTYQNAGRLYRRFVTPRRAASRRSRRHRFELHRGSTHLQVRHRSRKHSRVPVSIAPEWFAPQAHRRERAGFILTVAGEAPSKNLSRAIEAFAQYRRAAGEGALRMKIAGVKPPLPPRLP